jgi:hypothetical protein
MTALKPMELGEIIDRSAALWRAHWRKLYGLFFAFSLGQYALLRGYQGLQERFAPLSRGGEAALKTMKEDPAEFLRQALVNTTGFAVAFLIILFVTLFETTAASRYVMPAFLGQQASISAGLRHALKRLPALGGLFALGMGWALAVLLLLSLPGAALVVGAMVVDSGALTLVLLGLGVILAVTGLVVGLLWFFIRFAVWAQVLAMEDVGALQAFRRCDALTSGRVGPGFLGLVKVRLTMLITVVAALLLMISFVSGAPALWVRAAYGNLFDPLHADPNAVPQVLLVPAELFNIAVQCIVAPLYLAFQVVFYVDMRTRREGLDLELALQAGVKAP